jgi:histidine ammonia-lyase
MVSPISRQVYRQVREICPVFIEDTPFYEDIRNVQTFLMGNPLALD